MKKVIVLLLSFMLAMTSIPVASLVVYAENQNNNIDKVYGTPGEDYGAGEVLVCVKGGEKALAECGVLNRKPKLFARNADIMTIKTAETLVTLDSTEDYENNPKKFLMSDKANDNAISDNEESSLVLLKSNNDDVTKLIVELESLPCVEFAEPNVICTTEKYTASNASSEPYYDYQWYLDSKKTTKGIDVNAEEAYTNDSFASQKEVVVAVMDSGVDYTHPDLADSMWKATPNLISKIGGGEYGINTSGTGLESDPMDTTVGHGTHCASTIASTWNNNEGIAGVNGNAKIMACRWMADNGICSNFIKAMNYVIDAKKNGVNVVATNNSWGPAASTAIVSKSVQLIVEEASDLGIVSCFAAGNSGYNHDKFTNLNYNSPYILKVGAMDSEGNPAWFSERGASSVDVFAPGTQILAATSLQDSIETMPSQYLPWLQDSADSFFYEDFEDFDQRVIKLSSYEYDESGTSSNSNSTNSSFDGYHSSKSCMVNIDNSISVGDNLAIEFGIPLSNLLKSGSLPDSSNYYMAFQAGVNNMDYISISGSKHVFDLEYCSSDGNSDDWFAIDGARWRCIDGNWSISSSNLTLNQMNNLIAAAKTTGDTLRLRLTTTIMDKEDPASFYIDSFGFGTERSDYYYSDGTSMATPVTTAIASLIAGSMSNLPNSKEDVLELIAKIKGGVNRDDTNLEDECTSMGCVQADTAYKNKDMLYPVPETIVVSSDGNTATIEGYFLGGEQGTVKVDGNEATVKSWSDKKIVITIPNDTKYGLLEYEVIRTDNKSGREFGEFVNKQVGDKNYEELNMGNFQYGKLTSQDMIPLRLASNEDGIMALLVDPDCEYLGLEFYSFKTKEWTKITQPEGVDIAPIWMECNFSMVGGKDQFYLLCSSKDSKNWLLTYSTSDNKWIYKCDRGNTASVGEVLGLSPDGKLYIAGGFNSAEDPGVSQIYPDTGYCAIPESNIPDAYNTLSGGEYLISNTMHIMVGMNSGLMGRSFESMTGESGSPIENPAVLSNGQWIVKETNFCDPDGNSSDGSGNAGLDQNQVYIGAYGALDTGFIMAGPARDIGKSSMVDTWIYNANKDKYIAVPARVDDARMKMQAGVCRDGKFYVMGTSAVSGKTFFKCLDLADYSVTTTDNNMNAELETTNPCVIAVGNKWLLESGISYYKIGQDGHISEDGASADNYDLSFEPNINKITLNNINLVDIQNSKVADNKAAIYSKKDLIIELIGDNSIDVPDSENPLVIDKSAYGIYCKGNITIIGDGSINVKSGTRALIACAIRAEKSINLNSSGNLIFNGKVADDSISSYAVDSDMGTYGIIAKDSLNINNGKIQVIAESVSPLFVMDPSSTLHESVGIDSKNFNICDDAELTINCGDVSSLEDMNCVAIRTQNPAKIGNSKITAKIGKLYKYNSTNIVTDSNDNMNRTFSQKPVLGYNTDALIIYGDDEISAYNNGFKSFNSISSALKEKYIYIAASIKNSTPSQDIKPIDDKEIEKQKSLIKKTKISGFNAKSLKNGKIKLVFNRAVLKNGIKIKKYQIYRKTKNGQFKKIATIRNNKSSRKIRFIDKRNLKKSKRYYYKVRGVLKLSDGTYSYTKWSKIINSKCKRTRK